eukprot:TRINITY_DN988_c0_g2_i3.p1 TRINITY_DN988_c0_g2~~TRINITY_DN988_c0_g2_i3.p1  ORF type:complete len:240 (-),score=49.41 TRINITY_DN988_c0_g2_i3:364-1083(-)
MEESGKVALITGSNGISKAVAFALLDLGYDKFVMGYVKNEENAQQVQKDLEARNARAVMVQGSLDTEPETTISKYFEALETHYHNKLHAFIHSGGAYLQGEGIWDRYINLYPKSFALATERALKIMNDGEGKIVAVSSPGCNLSQIPRLIYPAGHAKAALEYQVRFYALREVTRKININCVIPGITNTTAWNLPLETLEEFAQKKMPDENFVDPGTSSSTNCLVVQQTSRSNHGNQLAG